MERPYHGLAQIHSGNRAGVLDKSYCFNAMRRSRVTSLPSGRSTASAGTKTPRTNRARMVRDELVRAGTVANVDEGVGSDAGRAGFGAIPSTMRDLRASNFGTPAESRATFASASASVLSSRRTCSIAKY